MILQQTKLESSIFGSAIFPPVSYFAQLVSLKDPLIEAHCHYSRQTYRNRYLILGANGILQMTVPVEKIPGTKTKTKDVLVSWDTPWNELHWKSIASAYNASPYFQYYEQDIERVFSKKWKYLLDMNLESVNTIIESLGLNISINLSDEYLPENSYQHDYREVFHPKKETFLIQTGNLIPYRQVFGQKHGFVPNLSILDLLFNKGPESLIVLKESLKEM